MERNIQVRLVCAEDRTPGVIGGHYVINRAARLSVCLVHKAASTVLLRLMLLLQNKGNSSTQLLSHNKWDVHHRYAHTVERLGNHDNMTAVRRMTKILTARNPYSRLWSAYVDKFHNPMFLDIGRKIVRKYRPNAKAHEITCGHDVTFPEFIKFVIGEGNRRGPLASHWLPVSEICDPCTFHPDFVVKQETLGQDIKAVIEHLALSNDIGDFFTNKKEESTLTDELDVHFRGFSELRDCMTKTQFLRRLWQGLLINGYVQPRTEIKDLFENLPFNITVILDTVYQLRKRYVVDKHMRDALRQKAMVKAYEQISSEEMSALQTLYKVDFKMFNYDSDPLTIFNTNQQTYDYVSEAVG